MAGAFDGLISDTGAVRNLSAAEVQQIQELQRTGQWTGPNTGGYLNGVQQWYDPSGEGNNDWRLQYQPGVRRQGGDAETEWLDPSLDQRWISKVREDTGGKLGDRWGLDGTYQGTFEAQDGGGRGFNQAAALIAGGYFGGQYLNGLDGAATAGAGATGSTAAEQIAFLSANGMTDAAIAASYPELAAAGGLTGVGGGAAAAAAGGATDWGSQLKTGLSTVGDGLKTLGINGGDLLRTGAAFALAKDVDGPQADPNLTRAITGLTGTADAANARAQSNDEYWRTTFAPRYLAAMDDQIAQGRALTDFNMGLAKKYDDRYWNTTAKQQDAFYDKVNTYDTDAARARFAGEAGANSDMQNAAAWQAMLRDRNRRGVNPNSGVAFSAERQQAQQGALQKTMAINMAREAARKEGLNMRAVAAGLGGNLTGATANFAGQAGQSAGIGMQGIGGANSGFNSSVGNWNATTGVGMNALNGVGNWGMGLTNGVSQANQMNTQGWNQMVGYGLGMFGSGRGG
jgi:hypothetical protein